jgi:hypothetical protein
VVVRFRDVSPRWRAYLKKIEPDLKAVGALGASAQLAMGLANWVEKHPDQRPADSMEMDATTTLG